MMADSTTVFSALQSPIQNWRNYCKSSKDIPVSEAELREQRISFAFGNAPQSLENRITKDSVRLASEHIRLLPLP